jgi:serine protease Do
MECPKCHFDRKAGDQACPKCGVIYSKYELSLKNKAENADKGQNNIEPSPTVKQSTPTISPLYKLKYYLGGIFLGIVTAALIIYHCNSKINKLVDQHNKTISFSDNLQTTPQEEIEIKKEPQDQSTQYQPTQLTEAESNSISKDIPANQGNESDSINIAEACKGVVTIKTATGVASGFFINEDGYILTNKHVSEMNDKVQDSLSSARKSFENQIKGKEELLSDLESGMAEKKKEIEKENSWLSENTNDHKYYYSKREAEEKLDEIKAHRAQLQEHIMAYNGMMSRYNAARATSQFLQQQYKQAGSQIINVAYNSSLIVYLADGSKQAASIISNSLSYDLSLLKIDSPNTPYVKPGDVDKLKVGETLYAIGSPAGLNQTVTSGILSGFREGYIQTNAQISPGNSGGPLINKEGKVIGINTKKAVGVGVEGIAFAIPINIAVQEFSQYFY